MLEEEPLVLAAALLDGDLFETPGATSSCPARLTAANAEALNASHSTGRNSVSFGFADCARTFSEYVASVFTIPIYLVEDFRIAQKHFKKAPRIKLQPVRWHGRFRRKCLIRDS